MLNRKTGKVSGFCRWYIMRHKTPLLSAKMIKYDGEVIVETVVL